MASKTTPKGTKTAQDRRARLEAAQRQQAAARRKRTLVLSAVAAVVVVAAVVGIVLGVTQGSKASKGGTPTAATGPSGGIVVAGKADAPVTLDLYEDFACPVCKAFEGTAGQTIQQAIDAGTVKEVFHPLTFVSENQGSDYSARTANTFACAAQAGEPVKYINTLFTKQPAEGSASNYPPTSTVVSEVQQAGVSGPSFASCAMSAPYAGWVTRVGEEASKRGVTGTPTVFLNGQKFDIAPVVMQGGSPATLKAAIDAAAGAKK